MTTLRFGRYTVQVVRANKVLFPGAGITKGELIAYYRRVAHLILPHLVDRPLVMQRFPDGIAAAGFYHKAIPRYFPDWIRRVTLRKRAGRVTHVVCGNEATLVYLANQACITPHIWLARRDLPHRPDRLIFDLDPPDQEFAPVRAAARALHRLLDELGLAAGVMTTGGRGVHVLVPLDRSAGFGVVRGFARDVARLLASRDPDRFTIETRLKARRGRLFLDYLRNGYAQTAVCPYAVRARPGAPVAVPLAWEELERPGLRGARYTIRNLGRRLDRIEDPWRDLLRHARSLAAPRARLARLLEADGRET